MADAQADALRSNTAPEVLDAANRIDKLVAENQALKDQIAAGQAKTVFGMYHQGNSEASMQQADAESGVHVPLSRLYYGMAQRKLPDPILQEQNGRQLLLSFAPRDNANPANWWTFASIANGQHDADIDGVGTALKSLTKKHYVGAFHEPETLIAQHGAGTIADYIKAWERTISRWKAMGLDHIWTPCFQARVPPGALPPTHGAVGCDPYCWYGVPGHMGPWVWPEDLFDGSVASMQAADAKAPMLICETGVGPDPRKPEWFTRMFATAVDHRLAALTYFSSNKETDWRVNSDAGSQAAWSAGMKKYATV